LFYRQKYLCIIIIFLEDFVVLDNPVDEQKGRHSSSDEENKTQSDSSKYSTSSSSSSNSEENVNVKTRKKKLKTKCEWLKAKNEELIKKHEVWGGAVNHLEPIFYQNLIRALFKEGCPILKKYKFYQDELCSVYTI